MHPRVNERNVFTADLLLRKFLGREFINEVVLLFLANEIKTVLKIRLNNLDCDLSSFLFVRLALFLLTLPLALDLAWP